MTDKEQKIKDLESTKEEITKSLVETPEDEKDKMKNAGLNNHLEILQNKIDKLKG